MDFLQAKEGKIYENFILVGPKGKWYLLCKKILILENTINII